MSLHNDPLSASPRGKPALTDDEHRARRADRLVAVRLRVAISRKLDERGIIDPHAIASAFEMPVREAMKLLNRHQWREGDIARLQALAARLGVQVPDGRPPRL